MSSKSTASAARTEVRRYIDMIAPLDEREQHDRDFSLKWIDSDAEIFRREKLVPSPHLVSYFVLLDLAMKQILLVDHKKSGLWLPSGGHVEAIEGPEEGEDPKYTVVREDMEELSDKADFVYDRPVFITVTETVPNEIQPVTHTDVSLWWVLKGDANREYEWEEREFHGIAWFDLDDIDAMERRDPELGRFAAKLTGLIN